MEESYNHAQCQWMDNMINACQVGCHSVEARAHKNGRLEEERETPIEARSLGKIIEPY